MMNEFEPFEGFDAEGSIISMVDEDGGEVGYHMLATKKDGDCLYMLVEEALPEDAELALEDGSRPDDLVAEVLIFKCVAEGLDDQSDPSSDEMLFELVDEEHESFELAFSLFKEDFDALGIEY